VVNAFTTCQLGSSLIERESSDGIIQFTGIELLHVAAKTEFIFGPCAIKKTVNSTCVPCNKTDFRIRRSISVPAESIRPWILLCLQSSRTLHFKESLQTKIILKKIY
jgi:hypothetical protein